MDRDKFIELLRDQQKQIAAIDHLVTQMEYNESIGYSQTDERRMHALADILFAANESLIGGFYKFKDNGATKPE